MNRDPCPSAAPGSASSPARAPDAGGPRDGATGRSAATRNRGGSVGMGGPNSVGWPSGPRPTRAQTAGTELIGEENDGGLDDDRRPRRPSLGGGIPAQGRELGVQGRLTVRRLLDAGLAEFDERGFQAVRVDDVVRRAKTSH